MGKKRVYNLAKELNITSKELIERANALGYSWIKSHANSLEDSEALELKRKIAMGGGQPQPKKKTVLRRRAVRSRTPSPTGSKEEYQVIVTRLSDGAEKVIERKRIEVSVPSVLPTFSIQEEAPSPAAPQSVETVESPTASSPPAASVAAPAAPAPVEVVQETQPEEQNTGAVLESTMQSMPEVKEEKSEAPAVALPQEAESKEPVAPAKTEAPAAKEPQPAAPASVREAPAQAAGTTAQQDPTPISKPAEDPKPKRKKEPTIRLGKEFKEDIDVSSFSAEKVEAPVSEPATVEIEPYASQPALHNLPTSEPSRAKRTPRPPEPRAARKPPGHRDEAGLGRAKKNRRQGPRTTQKIAPNRNDRRHKNKRRDKKRNKDAPAPTAPRSEKKRVIKVDEAITVGDLAHRMGIKAAELIRSLLGQGVFATINQTLSVEEATSLAREFNYDVQDVGFQIEDYIPTIELEEESADDLETRPPVVTVMGHVDHGKTSLLDAIRDSRVAASEAGGITQHIGASVVTLDDGRDIVFLDTPGHEAFTAMRSRGAQATDIVILVVAADDGIMPQTIEAINHAKAGEVPIVVAINKIDKAGANPMRVRSDLIQYGLMSEDFGGDTLMINVSAHTKEGIDELLENVLLQAEIMELQANPDKVANGVVIESHIEKGRGPVSTILVSEGTLRQGEIIVAGTHYGRIRAMFNDTSDNIDVAGPSMPCAVLGLSGTPEPGERFDCVADEKAAKQIIEHRRLQEQRKAAQVSGGRPSLIWGAAEKKEINLILKADTQGTLEAIKQSLGQLKHDEIELNIPHALVGGITEGDIGLASTTNSVVFGFHVRADSKAQRAAEAEGIEIRIYRVIYELIDSVKGMMEEQLTPTLTEKPIGSAEIRKTFNIPKVGRVAGCYVTDGKVTRGALIRLYRDNIQIYEGKVATLRRFKDDVKEVASGYECGIQIEGYQDIRVDDVIEAYEIEEVAQTLDI